MMDGLTFVALPAGAVLLDALVRPRSDGGHGLPLRSAAGLWLTAWLSAAFFGLFLAASGNVPVSVGLALASIALLVLVSNAKHAMLGEPLLFSDLALVGAIFRHPQFYLSAIKIWQRLLVALVAAILLAVLWRLFVPAPGPHLAGIASLLGSLGVLALSLRRSPWRDLAHTPDAYADVRRHGLLPTLLLYWLRWRESHDPQPCPDLARHAPHEPAPELAIVIQCESFADPAELFGDPGLALPGLRLAQANAWQWGRLEVSGFGAYTMRTEYGVLFGREEAELGFRRYDPFLTALGETSYALPARLKHAGWLSLFLHPHDMRFYNRDRIMPAGGFANLVGEDHFTPPAVGEGRYVTDAAIAEHVFALARETTQRQLIYAVTIENHGPWAPDGAPHGDGSHLVKSYLRLARNSDTMLVALLEGIAALKRPALLVFFGDHRPSIPGATTPDGPRHTPYTMIRIDAKGRTVPGNGQPTHLTPAGLHHAILDTILGPPADPPG